MPFRNSIVAAVIQTALSGARVVIDQFGNAGGQVRIYSGIATETAPESLSASWQGSPLNRYISRWTGATGTNMAGKQPPSIQLGTQEVTGDMSIDLIAERVTLFKSGGLVSPELRVDGPGGIDVLGAWIPFTFNVLSSTPMVKGASTFQGAYMQIGKIVHYKFRFVSGPGYVAGSGTYFATLPVPAKASAGGTLFDNGSGFIFNQGAAGVYAGNWYIDAGGGGLAFMIANSPGAVYMTGAQMAPGSNFGGSITYEAA